MTEMTYYIPFDEWHILYRGVTRTWMDDGVLKVEYVDGTIQTLGPISSYAIAVSHGYTGTEEEWEALLATTTQNAQTASDAAATAQAWVIGGTAQTTNNNASYYANKTAIDSAAAEDAAARAKADADSIKAASTVTTYQNSTDGVNPPADQPANDWTANPHPVQGEYTWARTIITWLNDQKSTVYNVSHTGMNGSGSVHSINTKIGHVTLYAEDIPYTTTNSNTIVQEIELLKQDTITNEQIDALFI